MKGVVKWREEYSVGVEILDEQHKKLISLMAEVQTQLRTGIQSRRVGEVLKELVDYTQYHFRQEEDLMKAIDFSGSEQHIKNHRKIAQEIAQILLSLRSGKELSLLDLFDLLRNWLVRHILHDDAELGKAYLERSPRASRVGSA